MECAIIFFADVRHACSMRSWQRKMLKNVEKCRKTERDGSWRYRIGSTGGSHEKMKDDIIYIILFI